MVFVIFNVSSYCANFLTVLSVILILLKVLDGSVVGGLVTLAMVKSKDLASSNYPSLNVKEAVTYYPVY